MASESKATPASKKEPLPVEKKLEMSLGDIEKARPRQRKNVKAKKEKAPGAKAADKSAQTKEKRGKKLASKRDGPNVIVSKQQKPKKDAKKKDPNLPRIVIKVDLTKVGKPQQQKKKQQQPKKQTKVVLH